MLTVVSGGCKIPPAVGRFSHLIADALKIEAHLSDPKRVERKRLERRRIDRLIASLSPIERSVIASRLLRSGIDEHTVLEVMSAVKEGA